MSLAPSQFRRTRPAVDPRPKRWTRKQYERLGELGFFNRQRVELVGGTIYRKSPGPRQSKSWKWTRKEYYRLWELGLIPPQRVQLINGEIYLMLPQKPPHAAAVKRVEQALEQAFGPAFIARIQSPLPLGLREDPEPDIAIVPGEPHDYARAHPTSALLVVEVSDTTLAFDRTIKGQRCSRGGVADYWIVNLVKGCLEVYRGPTRRGYKSCVTLQPDDFVSPLALPKAKIRVAELLP
jgi:Uma2 family endonuclease